MTKTSKVTKIVSGLIGLATVFSMLVGVSTASAQTTDIATLQAMIAQLQAQISAANANTGSCSYVFTTNLAQGSTGQQVWNLQKVLNMSADTQVAVTGAGSPGSETSYFGPATGRAVLKFQAKYGISQVGTVGPITRAKLNTMCSTPVVVIPGNPGTVVTGPVNVSLSTDNPASGYIVDNQATADLAHFTFTGNGSVNSITLKRTGISDQNSLTNVYLYDGVTRITDGYSFNNTGTITINNLNIAVNGSKTISVKADVATLASSGSATIAISLIGFTSGSSVNTVNVTGNLMNFAASAGTLGTVSVGTNTVSPGCTTACPSVNAGTTAYTFWSAPIQVNLRTMWLKAANFRMVGSAPSDALSNIRLYVDGVDTGKIATITSTNGSNYASFDLTAAPLALTTGSHTVDVRADIQKGSFRTVQFSLQQASDLMIQDPQVGVNVAVTNTGGSTFTANNAGTINIASGSATVVIDPTFQQLTNVTGGASNVAIGRFKVHAYGEDVKVQNLTITPVVSGATAGSSLDDVTLYFNGSQVGTQKDFTGAALVYDLGSQLVAPAGVDSFLEVRANIRTSTSTNYTDGTVAVTVNAGSLNAQGQNSQNQVSFPSTSVTGNTLTIQTGLLSVSKNAGYASQNANPNTAGVKIGSFVLQNQSSSESVRITSIQVALSGTASTTNFAGLRLSETSGSASTPVQPQSTNTFSTDFTLAPGATKIIDVLADTSTQSATVITTITVTSIGVSSNVSATSAATPGQTITLAAGTISTTPTLLSNSTVSQYIAAKGGLTDGTLASFKVVSTNGASTISELKYTVPAAFAQSGITYVKVAGVSAPVVSGIAYLTGLNIAVPNGGSGVSLDTYLSYSDVGATGIASGTTTQLSLTYIKYSSGGTTIATTTNVTSPTMTLVGSKPVVTAAKPASILSANNVEAIDVTVAADARGSITLNSLPITVSLNGATASSTATNTIIVKDENNQVVPTTNTAFGTTTGGTVTITFTNGYEITPSQPKTFKIFVPIAAVSGTGVNGASMSTSLAATSGFNWEDTAGGSTTDLTGTTLLPSYPNTFTSVIYN